MPLHTLVKFTKLILKRIRSMPDLKIVGGGLAGSEAAWQAAERGIHVSLYQVPGKELPSVPEGTQLQVIRRFLDTVPEHGLDLFA